MDSRSEKLKEIIMRQYPSIRAFSREVQIPHGTLVSALNNGIDGMSWFKLNQICKQLKIDAENLEPLSEYVDSTGLDDNSKRLLAYYNRLNSSGRAKVEEYINDISLIAMYTELPK